MPWPYNQPEHWLLDTLKITVIVILITILLMNNPIKLRQAYSQLAQYEIESNKERAGQQDIAGWPASIAIFLILLNAAWQVARLSLKII